jgi:hypothetical protein
MAGIYQSNSGEVLYDDEAVYENETVKKQYFYCQMNHIILSMPLDENLQPYIVRFIPLIKAF